MIAEGGGGWGYDRYTGSPVMGGRVITDTTGYQVGEGSTMGDHSLSVSKWVPSMFNSFDQFPNS